MPKKDKRFTGLVHNPHLTSGYYNLQAICSLKGLSGGLPPDHRGALRLLKQAGYRVLYNLEGESETPFYNIERR